MPQLHMPTIGNHRNSSKIAPISFNLVRNPLGKPPGFGGFPAIFSMFSAVDTRVMGTHRIPSLFHIITSMTASFVSLCSPTGRVMGRERVWEIPGLSDLADLAYINLDKWSWRQPSSRRGMLQFGKHYWLWNHHHFQSETPRFYVSNIIFTMNGSLKYCENIKKYVLRCTTIGFKQKYGHKSSRRADINLRCKSDCREFSAETGQYFVGCTS